LKRWTTVTLSCCELNTALQNQYECEALQTATALVGLETGQKDSARSQVYFRWYWWSTMTGLTVYLNHEALLYLSITAHNVKEFNRYYWHHSENWCYRGYHWYWSWLLISKLQDKCKIRYKCKIRLVSVLFIFIHITVSVDKDGRLFVIG
jgi:hypothetical protein